MGHKGNFLTTRNKTGKRMYRQMHELIRYFKGTSSRKLRNKYPELRSRIPSLWTRSYFCCTIGCVSEETIQKYIENQKNV
jgi:putative transposase